MWSLDEYCKTELIRQQHEDWSNDVTFPASSRTFLQSLRLPSVHPFCDPTKMDDFVLEGIPPMGPLLQEDYHHHIGDVIVTQLYHVLPALLAMAELWLRLFAAGLAPLGITYLMYRELIKPSNPTTATTGKSSSSPWLSLTIILTVASSVVLLTDTLYVLEYGSSYGLVVFVTSSILALRACSRHQLSKTLLVVFLLKLLTGYLIFHPKNNNGATTKSKVAFGNPADAVTKVQEGLYYNPDNPHIQSIVDAWPEQSRTYSKDTGATSWMPTGDSRTGLPFILNKVETTPTYHRLWLETIDHEYVALDVSFPPGGGHSQEKPLYLIFHGLNGGSHEEYVMECTHRRNAEGSTVVVMVARGLMDLPIQGWNMFHGARVDDAHAAAMALRQVTGEHQTLAAIGYSMGAIILSNYVARMGADCPLDAAVAISGGLDMRYENHFYRAQRLWQPMLAQELRDTFLTTKWGERVRARLSLEDMKRSMRASHVTEIDRHAVAPYNGYDNVTHYYMEMSALGDIPLEAYRGENLPENARIHTVAIPFCVVHSLDDPLVTWRTIAANEGLMHPAKLTANVRSGNLLVLLTKAGGHVGWPLGWRPSVNKWKWMNDLAMNFVEAVDEVSRQKRANAQQCSNPDDESCQDETQ